MEAIKTSWSVNNKLLLKDLWRTIVQFLVKTMESSTTDEEKNWRRWLRLGQHKKQLNQNEISDF